MAINDEIREQRQKLKGQGFKAHLSYFWAYYKLHTIAALVLIIIIVTTVRDIRAKKPYAFYALVVNSYGMETQEILQQGFSDYAGIDLSTYDCLIDTSTIYNCGQNDDMSIASSEKIFTLIAAGDLDVMVADEPTAAHFASQGDFIDLRDVYSEDELYSLGDDILYVDQAYLDYINSDDFTGYLMSGEADPDDERLELLTKYGENGEYRHIPASEMAEPIPVGIIIKGSTALKESEAYISDTAVVGIVANTGRIDTAVSFVDYLLK